MLIGIPKETFKDEKRIALAPAGVDMLVKAGHTVFVESGAGHGAHFEDEDFREVGADVVYSSEEVFKRAEFLVKVGPVTEDELDLMHEHQIIFSFLQLSVGRKIILEKLIEKKITALSYEFVEKNGVFEIMQAMSQITGQLAVRAGERFLGSSHDASRGIMMGGIPGIAPAAVVILGAGEVGLNAARSAYARGAQVIVLDKDIQKLKNVEDKISKNITTVKANPYTISRGVEFADLLICAARYKAEKAPILVTEEMVKKMKKGAVIVDVSVDHGGNVATTRPTTLTDPIYVKHDVIHYCVPNMSSTVARSATYGLTNSSIEYISEIADQGLENAISNNESLIESVCTYNGSCVSNMLAETYGLEYKRLQVMKNN